MKKKQLSKGESTVKEQAIRRRFFDGISEDAYRYLGCHREENGFVFRVWAPNAKTVKLLGSFNGWNTDVPPMTCREGIWEERREDCRVYDEYKYYVESPDGTWHYKADPYAFHAATRPETNSRVYDLSGYEWQDAAYRRRLGKQKAYASAIHIYEMHLGSWRKHSDGNPYSYRDLARELVPYLVEMGYTHLELLPVTEHPFDGSWGYQVTGFYAPTSRFGTPHDFMALVDACHQGGIGVILDWVGAHFPKDEAGLYFFDGTPCYESGDPSRREHKEWGTHLFDFRRHEVRSFLRSSVAYWLNEYHVDGIRVDAVSTMIYRDYANNPDCWRYGDNNNYDAISLLRDINRTAYRLQPKVLMIAEEATAFPLVTKPDYDGGLGFGFKWNMGWMHDTLDYMSADPLFRKGMHDKITFSLTYAFSENFVLPFSHDEVVHGKRSLIGKMPGEYDDKFDNLRVLYAYQMAHPGKKLTFMGSELAQFIEWDEKRELDWFLLDYERHRQMKEYVRDLNRFYLSHPALYENDADWDGFSWLRVNDCDNSVFAFRRSSLRGQDLIAVFNFCPVRRTDYRLGLPYGCHLKPIFDSDASLYGGKGQTLETLRSEEVACDGFEDSVLLDLPPMSAIFYQPLYRRR